MLLKHRKDIGGCELYIKEKLGLNILPGFREGQRLDSLVFIGLKTKYIFFIIAGYANSEWSKSPPNLIHKF